MSYEDYLPKTTKDTDLRVMRLIWVLTVWDSVVSFGMTKDIWTFIALPIVSPRPIDKEIIKDFASKNKIQMDVLDKVTLNENLHEEWHICVSDLEKLRTNRIKDALIASTFKIPNNITMLSVQELVDIKSKKSISEANAYQLLIDHLNKQTDR